MSRKTHLARMLVAYHWSERIQFYAFVVLFPIILVASVFLALTDKYYQSAYILSFGLLLKGLHLLTCSIKGFYQRRFEKEL